MNKARVAVTALRQAHTADYGNYEAAWKLARAAFYVVIELTAIPNATTCFAKALKQAKRRSSYSRTSRTAIFGWAQTTAAPPRTARIANLSSFQDIKGEMEAVLKIDESYQGYSAYLGLGRLYLQAPKVLGGDSAKAMEYLEKGVKLNPNNTLMRYHLAEAYEANNRNADAKKQIETLMATDSRSEVRRGAQSTRSRKRRSCCEKIEPRIEPRDYRIRD